MNLIDSVRFDIKCADTQLAKDIQDKIFALCRHTLSPLLDEAVESADVSGRFEAWSLDLGDIPYSSLDSQLVPKLVAAFEKKLEDLVPENTSNEEGVNQLEIVRFFLEKGLLHWSQRDNSFLNPFVKDFLSDRWPDFISFLKYGKYMTNVVQRIVLYFDVENYTGLVHKLQPVEAQFVLNFISDVVATSERAPQLWWRQSDLEYQIKQLVISDLIRNHGSLFNRKMFIRSQLQGMVSSFQLDYQELLLFFDSVIRGRDFEFSFKSTLPALVKELIDDTIDLKLAGTSSGHLEKVPWHALLTMKIDQSEREELAKNWKEIINSYGGEMAKSLHEHVVTRDHVDFIIATIGDEKAEDLIRILEPNDGSYILGYKHEILKSEAAHKFFSSSQTGLIFAINSIILSFILLEKGSRFNKKQFLMYQIGEMAQHFRIRYVDVLTFIANQLSSRDREGATSEMLVLLIELRDEQNKGALLKVDEDEQLLLIIKDYLTSGLFTVHNSIAKPEDFIRSVNRLLTISGRRMEISQFLEEKKEIIADKTQYWNEEVFYVIIEFLIRSKLKLKMSEPEGMMQIIRKGSLKTIDFRHYKKSIFLNLIDFSKLNRDMLREYRLDATKKKSKTLIFRYFQAYVQELAGDVKLKIIPDNRALNLEDPVAVLLNELIRAKNAKSSISESFKGNEKILESIKSISASEKLLVNSLVKLGSSEWKIITAGLPESLLDQLMVKIQEYSLSRYSIGLDFKNYNTADIKRDILLLILAILRDEGVSNHTSKTLERKWQLLDGKFPGLIVGKGKPKPSHRREDTDYYHTLEDFLSSGVLPKHTDLVIIQWHLKGDNKFYNLVKNASMDDSSLRKWTPQLSQVILMRFLQVLTGGHFSNFMSLTKDVEKLLKLGLQGGENYFEPAEIWIRRLIYARTSRTTNLRFEHMMRSQIRELAGPSRTNYLKMSEKIVSNLMEHRSRIHPPALRKKLDWMVDNLVENKKQEDLVVPELNEELQENSIAVGNAGLILLWPFYKKLFDRLNYLNEDGQFLSSETKIKAVQLLQFIGSGLQEHPEFQTSLSKILVGMKLAEPFREIDVLSTDEIELAEDMLAGAIANWDKLENTSIEGLRNSFLMRNGTMLKDDGDWVLQVERMGVDVLLNFIPWGISNVKLPWNNYVIYVSWQ